MTAYSSTTMTSPIGEVVLVASDRHLRAVLWSAEDRRWPESGEVEPVDGDEHPVLAEARRQLGEYFAGTRGGFDLPLASEGTAFQRAAWDALRSIPFGATITYGEQARRMGRPSAVRAVGAANGKNLLGIVVPCHRVVGADGTLTGFAGGVAAKGWLLGHEAAVLARSVPHRG